MWDAANEVFRENFIALNCKYQKKKRTKKKSTHLRKVKKEKIKSKARRKQQQQKQKPMILRTGKSIGKK